MPPNDITEIEWLICPECDGKGKLDASCSEDPPWSCEVECWRCKGGGGWLEDDRTDESESEDWTPMESR